MLSGQWLGQLKWSEEQRLCCLSSRFQVISRGNVWNPICMWRSKVFHRRISDLGEGKENVLVNLSSAVKVGRLWEWTWRHYWS